MYRWKGWYVRMLSSKSKITYLDLFAGAGGLSEGFASVGYQPVAHVEMDIDACNTLKTRECYYYLSSKGLKFKYMDYLKKKITREQLYNMIPREIIDSVVCETMSVDSMPSVFARIDRAMKFRNIKTVDIILGGPPCQAYSMAGRARKNMDGDPRNTLYKLYFQALERYHPTMFVFENVPGLLTAGSGSYLENIISGFCERGYEVEQQILNASEYGVLQNRRRIILIGWRQGTDHKYPELKAFEKRYKVASIFEDLPELIPGEEKSEYSSNSINEYLTDTGIRQLDDVLTWHVARNNLERDRDIYRLAIKEWDENHKRLVYSEIPNSLATHKNKSSFLDRFKVVAADVYATQTMVAHISKDGHYYIHPSMSQARSISVREAARIQSFPDNFYFEGSRTAAFRQIGNAVPPQLAKTIAKALREQFGGN